MSIKVKLDPEATFPTKAHPFDAGFDLYSREEKVIKARGSAIFDTGVHMVIPKGCVGMLKSKSGLNVKHNLVSEGVVYADYTGSIIVKIYNNGSLDYLVHKGDKITQIVVMPICVDEIEETDKLPWTQRNNSGFGSTGR